MFLEKWRKPKKNTLSVGSEKELEAEAYLRRQGLQPLSRNYRCKMGEIDLVMRDGQHLVFVEVRYRRNNRYGSAAESITAHKQQKLLLTANHYLQSQKTELPCRFDAVCIEGTAANITCQWIKNIFSA